MERVFQFAAVVLVAAAVYFFWQGNHDMMFVAGVLGCVMFFINIRVQVKARNDIRDREILSSQDEKEG